MKIDQPGWVTERILLLGRRESCVYLLKGNDEFVLLGGGMVHIVPDVLNQLNEFGIGEDKIKRIIILNLTGKFCPEVGRVESCYISSTANTINKSLPVFIDVFTNRS